MSKTLVIILSETRASELTFENFKKNVIDELKADLCVCIGVKADYDYENPFYKLAKHRFIYEEPVDFGEAFEYAYDILKKDVNTPKTTTDDEKIIVEKALHWREFLKIKDQFLGGIKDPNHQHIGSAGILIFFRWFLLENLYISNVINKYDRFIITRSDFIYKLPHPHVEMMDPEKIWIPDAEHYGGFTDRHVILSRQHVKPYLNILNNLISRSNEYFMKMKHIYDVEFEKLTERMHYLCNDLITESQEVQSWDTEHIQRFKKYIETQYFSKLEADCSWNLEKLIKFHLEQNDVLQYVKEFPYVMYTVRNNNGVSRWAGGEFNETLQYYVKYKTEYDKATSYLTQFEASKFENIQDYYLSICYI